MMDFCSTHVFSVKKAGNSADVTAGGIMSLRTHDNSLCREKKEH
jgi:hypothetical protein